MNSKSGYTFLGLLILCAAFGAYSFFNGGTLAAKDDDLDMTRLAAERPDTQRLEAERLEAERLETERLETERLEAERLEVERLAAERLEAERFGEAKLPDAALLDIEWLIEPVLANAASFNSGYAWIQEEKDGPWSLVDKEGNRTAKGFQAWRVAPISFSTSSPDLGLSVFVKLDDKELLYGYVNASGEPMIPPKYQFASSFSEGLAVVQQADSFGVIDSAGAVVIPFIYESTSSPFRGGLMPVQKDGKWGYIDTKGETVTGFVFEDQPNAFARHADGFYPAVSDGKAGFMDKEGKWVLEPVYERIYSKSEDLIGIQQGGKVGFVDGGGRPVIKIQYNGMPKIQAEDLPDFVRLSFFYLYSFSEGRALVLLSDNEEILKTGKPRFGVIDTEGELLFELPGWPHGGYKGGVLPVTRYGDDKAGMLDKSGRWHDLPATPSKAVEILHSGSDGIYLVYTRSNQPQDDQSGSVGYLKVRERTR